MSCASLQSSRTLETVTLFLCGDVMTGRGVDQVLPAAGDPRIFEPVMESARGYVELAERVHGPVPAPVDPAYPWGKALEELERVAPDVRIVNLETAVTTSDARWRGKRIHYRMHPDNVTCLSRAGIDCCVLANNHVLDWGVAGLRETLRTLEGAGIATVGAGDTADEADAPAVLDAPGEGRVLVFGLGAASSGIPREWRARSDRPGVHLLDDLSGATVRKVGRAVTDVREPDDVVVASIHWGANWGYEVPEEQRAFARGLIDEAGVDVVHGHSSHHAKGIEIHANRPILYGCGDFLNDYEGISGHERFRGDLAVMYFLTLDGSGGGLVDFTMVPLRLRRFRLERAPEVDVEWLRGILDREGERLGTRVAGEGEDRLNVRPR